MDVLSGWSLDFTGARRRMAALAAASLIGTTLIVPATALAATYDPATDPYSMYSTLQATWSLTMQGYGYAGKGVDVALIDTGVAPVEGLATPGKIIYGPDLSLESQNPAFRNLDTNGHGTFMAGLIAGKDSTLVAPYNTAPASVYRGMAPDARIVSVKVGDADGGTDVSQVIAAIDWVVQHKTDNGMNIRVINLSYGTNSTQASGVDPLAYAVEQAWKKGIVVVAAAGNTGYQRGNSAPGLADPAYNPYIIAVGGFDTNGTVATSDDTMGTYSASSTGCGSCKNPDFVAVGSHLQGLRVPGGFLDQTHPEGLLGTRFFRGSGTSEAAAITSGSIAQLLSMFPTLTPDQVKNFIRTNAVKVPGADTQVQGGGEINLAMVTSKNPGSFTQKFTNATGTGTLDSARGTDRLTAPNGVTLSGEQDIFGHTWSSSAMATAEAAGNTWSGGAWNGNTWSGNTWSGNSWSGNTWSGNSWSGNTWSGNTWSGNTWSGNTWSGNTWSGNSWSGNTWSGNTWSGGSWN
jgi:serine protease AprX